MGSLARRLLKQAAMDLSSDPPGAKKRLIFGAALWVLLVGAGFRSLLAYSLTSGEAAHAPAQWPAETALLSPAGGPTLLVFLHPRCPCSRATSGELALLMAQTPHGGDARVFFLRPAGVEDDWVETDLWRSVSSIPGVTVFRDDEGVEARRFGAATSGETMLYDKGGRLLFHGGITSGRGHSGDNDGRSALTALMNGNLADRTDTAVFGCPLFAPEGPCTHRGSAQCPKS